jgi:hypothetical protein
MLSSFQIPSEGTETRKVFRYFHSFRSNKFAFPRCRTATPSLSEKSQSHREISRSRGEKREVSFATPAQRTRSLTREEAKMRDDGSLLGYDDRSASAQRLMTSTDRPSRADSRVTFALDTVEKEQPPIPPIRSKDHAKQEISLGNHTDRNIAARDQVSISQTNLNNKTILFLFVQNDSLFFSKRSKILSREREQYRRNRQRFLKTVPNCTRRL